MAFAFRRQQARKLAAALALVLAAPFTQGATGMSNSLEDRLLAAHNRERAALGIPPLAWDRRLARDAAAYALHIATTGRLEHSEDDPRDPDPQGENLWAGTSGYYGPEQMVGLWIDERKIFVNGPFPKNATNGRWRDVGHYTQLIWRSTTQVGCAVAHSDADEILVCRYLEGGNVLGENPY